MASGMCRHGKWRSGPTGCIVCHLQEQEESRVRVRKSPPIPYIQDIVGTGGDESLPTEEEEEDKEDYRDYRDPAEIGLDPPSRRREEPEEEWNVPPVRPLVTPISLPNRQEVTAPKIVEQNPHILPLLTIVGRICGVCKQQKGKVLRNRKTGQLICKNCSKRVNVGQCTKCRETKVIIARGFCSTCYQQQRRAKIATQPV
jgi:hypothetical protein